MQETLEALGLSSYEAKTLARLLMYGPTTGPQLARDTGVPFGRIYDTLAALEERQLVQGGTGRPRTYTATDARTLPNRLLAANRKRLQDDEQEAVQHTARLEQALKKIHAQPTPATALYGVQLGEAKARDFLIESTLAARQSISAYLAFERLRDDDLQLFFAFKKAVTQGVRTRLIIRKSDVEYLLSTPYVDDVVTTLAPHLGRNLEVRLANIEGQPFCVLDSERVALGIRNPLDPASYFAVVHMDDRAFARDLDDKFETLWRQARFEDKMIKAILTRKGLAAIRQARRSRA